MRPGGLVGLARGPNTGFRLPCGRRRAALSRVVVSSRIRTPILVAGPPPCQGRTAGQSGPSRPPGQVFTKPARSSSCAESGKRPDSDGRASGEARRLTGSELFFPSGVRWALRVFPPGSSAWPQARPGCPDPAPGEHEVAVRITGPETLRDAMALGCSLGPWDVLVDDIGRSAADQAQGLEGPAAGRALRQMSIAADAQAAYRGDLTIDIGKDLGNYAKKTVQFSGLFKFWANGGCNGSWRRCRRPGKAGSLALNNWEASVSVPISARAWSCMPGGREPNWPSGAACPESRVPFAIAARIAACALSHGFVRGETLSCIYHGWVYRQSGACSHIPPIPIWFRQPPSRLKNLTCIDHGGVVFVSDTADMSGLPDLSGLAPVRSLNIALPAAR